MFFRTLLLMLLAIAVLTAIRMFARIITKGIGGLFENSPTAGATPPAAPGGELKRDPVCGTFVAAASSIKKTYGSETVHFCSPECRDRYRRA